MATPETLEELESLEAIYDGSSDVVIKRTSAEPGSHDAGSRADLEVDIYDESLSKRAWLTLRLWLPLGYLIDSECSPIAPSFELESSVCSRSQLSAFCGELDRLFERQSPCPILFSWIEWLRIEASDATEVSTILDRRALKVYVAEAKEETTTVEEPEVQTCSVCLKTIACEILPCQHMCCSSCLAASIQVESANSAPHCCPLPSCRAPLSKEILCCGEAPPEAWMHVVRQISGTAFQDAVVFCPRCEDRGMDMPVLLANGRKIEQVDSKAEAVTMNCACFFCNHRFCGICRSPCHSGACFDDNSRVVRFAKRRPPLASELQDMAIRLAREIKTAEADNIKRFGEAKETATDFDSLQSFFLQWHEASILNAVAGIFGSDVSLYKAPVSERVKQRFMIASTQYPDVELLPAFHGSDARNYASIFDNGLLIPGDGNSVRMAHGAAHGRGVYTANLNAAWLSRGFCSDPIMLVCGVLQTSTVRHVFDAMVVGDSSHVVPLLVCEASRCAGHLLPLPPPARVKPTTTTASPQKGKADITESSSDKKAKNNKFKAKLAKMSQRH